MEWERRILPKRIRFKPFPRVSLSQTKHVRVQLGTENITMSSLRILVVRDDSLFDMFEVSKPTTKQNNAMETSNSAIYTLIM
jgi:hypothetical protein